MRLQKDYGLIGYPLSHSISPFVHGEIFKRTKEKNNYSLYEIQPEELSGKYTLLSSLAGFNVTAPLNELILPYCEKLDKSADCGVVNCVNNEKVGFNTDIFGFEKSVKALGASLKSRVCLIGYGGAGKMIAHAVEKAGGKLTITEKDPKKMLKSGVKVNLVKTKALSGSFDLIINASPVGSYPKIKNSPVNFKKIKAAFALDLIYTPYKTEFLKLAETAGAKTMNGVTMLVWQSIKSHEAWYGGKVSDNEAVEIIEATRKFLGGA